jgi:hypothetical protein
MLGMATKVLSDYGKVLGGIEPGSYGMPESFLPHSKTAIREATKTALGHLGLGQPAIREALIRGYVYLCQFVPDIEAEVLLATGLPDDDDFDLAVNAQALSIINRIKLDMERALEEIRFVGVTADPR